MRIGVYPADEGGCGYYRMIWPAEAVAAEYTSMEVTIHPASEPEKAQIKAMVSVDETGKERVHDVLPLDFDVIVLQRPLNRLLAEMIPHIQNNGTAVVVEIDDDFEALDPNNVAWKQAQPQHSPDRNKLYLREACKIADWVICSTPALAARYGKHGRVTVAPNFAREKYLKVEKTRVSDKVTIGWSGSVLTHPRDLQETRGAVWAVMQRHDADLFVVGTGIGINSRLGIPESLEVASSGWLDIDDDYPRAMASIDVGIVPLEINQFNHAKSWLKGIEFASLGVPFIASPTEQYTSLLARYHIGANAIGKHRSWFAELSRLVPSLEQATEAGRAARMLIDSNDMVIERQAHIWATAWRRAADVRMAA